MSCILPKRLDTEIWIGNIGYKMNKAEKTYLWFTSFVFLHYERVQKLIELFGDVEDIFDKLETKAELVQEIVGGVQNYNKMLFARDENFLQSYINNLKNMNIEVVTQASANYPKKLLQVECPPFILFCKGNLKLLEANNGLAVVGTRRPTFYGRDITEKFCKVLCKNGFLLVSGMADGIDSIAHRTALENNEPTIAVLGGGFNHIYPASNLELSKKIEENGLLVSEYPPSHNAKNYDFIKRNRIIAGLSKCVLIPEAGKTSGALHTKNYALETGREVFAIPGNVNSPMSEGTNNMIKTQHVACATDPQDILDYYKIAQNPIKMPKAPQLSLDQMLIRGMLEDGETDFETLQEKTNLDTKTLNSCLTSMQISGIIKKLPGNKFSL